MLEALSVGFSTDVSRPWVKSIPSHSDCSVSNIKRTEPLQYSLKRREKHVCPMSHYNEHRVM